MKKLYFLLVIALFAACTNDEEMNLLTENLSEESVSVEKRSFQEALEVAQASIEMLQYGSPCTKNNGSNRTIDLTNGVKVVYNNITRTEDSSSANDTLLYVFNFEDNQGFAVVSASRQTEGLIAVTESGHYNPDKMMGIPGFDTFMQTAKLYVATTTTEEFCNDITPETRSSSQTIQMCKHVYDTVYYRTIEPRVSVRWGQSGCLGQFCPNNIAGCANTAAAQIMSYFKYPTTLTLTYSGRDVNSTTLNWDAMCNNNYLYANDTINQDETGKQIGRLARQLGHLAGSTYANQTSTTMPAIRSVFQSLGYTVGNITIYDDLLSENGAYDADSGYPLASQLAAGNLIFMGGLNNNGDGHAWVVDGCFYVKAYERIKCTYDGETWFVYQECGTLRRCHNHINWGYNGIANGYFYHHIFKLDNAISYDDNSLNNNSSYNGSTYNFYNNVQYFTVYH